MVFETEVKAAGRVRMVRVRLGTDRNGVCGEPIVKGHPEGDVGHE